MLLEILSIMVHDFAVTQVGLAVCGRSRFEYIILKKSEILLSLSYISKSALKSPRRTTGLFSLKMVPKRFER